jgi:glycosyltransferase involved in cell wall biosynthesis
VKCVFHERLEIPEDRGYHEKVKEAGNGNVLLSLKPVPYDELDKVFASADIGLAIYNKSYGENFSTIGSASGKLFQYIKHGVPVIVSNLPGLADLVEEYEMGIAVGSPSEIPRAIEKILEDRPRFSRNARKAFEENLNMDIHLDRVYQSLSAEAC